MMGNDTKAEYILEIQGEPTRELLEMAKLGFHTCIRVSNETGLSFEEAMCYFIKQTGLPFVLRKEE